jgi:hypothetical protein
MSRWRASKVPGIKANTKEGREMLRLLANVRIVRKQWKLPGSKSKYDFNLGCYGNPSSKIMFVAEIASLENLEKILERKPLPEKLWTTAWEGRTKNRTLREILVRQGLIPPDSQETPWKWKCWITNFVKSADVNKLWKARIYKKDKIIRESAEIFLQELRIIRPAIVVFVGNKSYNYFVKHVAAMARDEMPDLKINKVRHYGAHESPETLKKHYTRKLNRILR